jgi:hypothetical protein
MSAAETAVLGPDRFAAGAWIQFLACPEIDSGEGTTSQAA